MWGVLSLRIHELVKSWTFGFGAQKRRSCRRWWLSDTVVTGWWESRGAP